MFSKIFKILIILCCKFVSLNFHKGGFCYEFMIFLTILYTYAVRYYKYNAGTQ